MISRYWKKGVAILLLSFSSSLWGQAVIGSSKTDVCLRALSGGGFRSDNVTYTLNNCTGCNSIEWDVGAGFQATGAPQYVASYSTSGSKNVSCRFRTSSGGSSTISLSNAVFVRDLPVINIGFSDTVVCLSKDSFVLTDNSANIVSRQWLVNGQNYNPGPKSIKFGFPENTAVSVFLSVKDIYGCVNNYLKDSAVLIGNPVTLDIVPNATSGCAPKLINFSATIDSGAQYVKSFAWTFQNATPSSSSSRNPRGIRFNLPDTNDVGLTITTGLGCNFSVFSNNLISLGDSTTLDLAVSGNNVCANKQIIITNTNSKTGTPSWSILNVKYAVDSVKGKKLYIRLLDTGTADIRIWETVKGCYSTSLLKNSITVKGPKAFFNSLVSTYCSTPDTLSFDNTSVKSPGVTNWQWDIYEQGLGRVGGGIAQNFNYITNKFATYDVRLIASGANGCRDTILKLAAAKGGKMKAGFTVAPYPACANQNIKLIDATENKRAGIKHTYRWTYYNSSGGVAFSSNILSPSYSYASLGKYKAKLFISNAKGCKDSVTYTDTIVVAKPSFQLFSTDTTICAYENTTFWLKRALPNPSAFASWAFTNLDQTGIAVYRNGDTAKFLSNYAGRWRVRCVINDTSGGGCITDITFPQLLKVSGLDASVKSTPDFGCQPLNVSLTSTLAYNYDFENPTNIPLKYKWKQNRYIDKGFVFGTPNSQNTSGTGPKGIHYIQVVVQNGSGCYDSSEYITITSGVKASFEVISPTSCVGHILDTRNTSASWATSYEYVCDSSSVQFLPNKFAKEPKIKFTKPGYFYISLITKYQSCVDTFLTIIRADQVIADFASPDTVSYCAPIAAKFKNLSTGPPKYNTWSFGNGSQTSLGTDDVANLYRKNKPKPGYDIQLIADNGRGCKDTMLKKGYINIIGPVPKLQLKNNVGCETLKVEFINASTDYSRFFLDYDDGSFIDSTQVANHNYVVQNSSLVRQRFLPSILLYDDNNCAAFEYADDTIEVLKKPNAKFSFTSTRFINPSKPRGCADDKFLVNFSNLSQFYNSSSWDLDGDGIIDVKNINNPSFFYRNSGSFVPSIVVAYVNGCKDTFKKDTIIALDAPKADFKILVDSICIKTSAKFIDQSVSIDPIRKYKWDFGEPNFFDDTASIKNPSYAFRTPFEKFVTMSIEDINGCTASAVKAVYIADTAGPKAHTITYVTVNPDNSITLNWLQTKIKNYYSYRIIEETPSRQLKNEFFNRKDTNVSFPINSMVNTNRFCYTIQLEDTCGQKGQFASTHCTILLSTKSTQTYHNELSWFSYEYWGNQLSHYEIYRKTPSESNFIKIDEVSASRQSYVDSFLCNLNYCYYIKAINKNRKYSSSSNRACQTPIYKAPDLNLPIELVTVENNKYIKVNWKKYPIYVRGGQYLLQKANFGAGTYSNVGLSNNASNNDLVSNFNKNSFNYRVKFIDHCGAEGPAGRPSNSIFLTSPSITGVVDINWTPYKEWSSGVKQYDVEYRDKTGAYINYATLPGTVNTLTNLSISSFAMDSVCLRIIATKDTSIEIKSISNLNCFVDKSEIWVPTAFSPNNDGKNDLFKVYARNVRGDDPNPNYRSYCKIYNRWGQKVFETNDFNIGWDGTFEGNTIPNGLYIVKVFAVGYDGEAFRYNGTLNVER